MIKLWCFDTELDDDIKFYDAKKNNKKYVHLIKHKKNI